jgi:hypothetical protein
MLRTLSPCVTSSDGSQPHSSGGAIKLFTSASHLALSVALAHGVPCFADANR